MLLHCSTASAACCFFVLLLLQCIFGGCRVCVFARYLVPVRTSSRECGMPAVCVTMGVPIVLGKAMPVLALWCCGLLRASSVQAWILARAARHPLSSASGCDTTRRSLLVRPGPAGCFFRRTRNIQTCTTSSTQHSSILLALVFRIFGL